MTEQSNSITPSGYDVESIVSSWERAVREVEVGYSTGIDEYIFDLSATRDCLERCLNELDDAENARLRRLVEQIDARFKAATIDDTRGSLSRFFKIGAGWWWHRIPTRGSLRTYLDEAAGD